MVSQHLSQLQTRLLLFVGLILLLALSRSYGIHEIGFNSDEARTALRAQGTMLQIALWQPSDWPPLHNIVVGLWARYLSSHPDMLKFQSFLLIMPSIALMFQVARRFFRQEQTALLAMLAYGSLGYVGFLSTYVRGYGLALSLLMLLIYLSLKYFDNHQETRLAVGVGVVIALTFYTTYTSIFAFAFLGLYTLLRYRGLIWRWIVPVGLAFVLVLPQLLQFASTLSDRAERSGLDPSLYPPFLDSMVELYQGYTGSAWIIWFALALIALVLMIVNHQSVLGRIQIMWLVLATLVAPIIVYLCYISGIFILLNQRYAFWGMIPIALLIAGGLTYLPHRVKLASIALFAGLIFFPEPYLGAKIDIPIEQTFYTMQDDISYQDVIVVDPSVCISVECDLFHKWTYYYNFYFYNQLPIVDDPTPHHNIWYIHRPKENDQSLENQLASGRLSSGTIGMDNFSITYFASPPNTEGVRFDNGLRFHGLDIIDDDGHVIEQPTLREQDGVHLRLWWSVDQPLTETVAVNLTIVDESDTVLVDDHHTPQLVKLNPDNPFILPQAMTDWQANTLYISEQLLQIPQLYDPTLANIYLSLSDVNADTRISFDNMPESMQLWLHEVRIQGW